MVGDELPMPTGSPGALGQAKPFRSALPANAFVDDSTTQVAPVEAAAVSNGTCSGQICYHGGSIMPDRMQVYYIWYGDWRGSAVPSILNDFIWSLGNTHYYRINTTYNDQSGASVLGRLGYGGNYYVGFTHGNTISSDDIGEIVAEAIYSGNLPYDRNGIYFVMASRSVHTPGMCDSFCAWHSHENVPVLYGRYAVEMPTLYGFIGHPMYCSDHPTPGMCEAQLPGPNGPSGADGMANLLAHEIAETVTNPFGGGWWAPDGDENGDLCAWTFGAGYTAPNGTWANIHLGDRDYLLQQIYNRNLRRCTISLGG
jgi:hypothetical protein